MSKAGKKRNQARNEGRATTTATMESLASELAAALETDVRDVGLCCEATARAAIAAARCLKGIATTEINRGRDFTGLYVGRSKIENETMIWVMRETATQRLTSTQISVPLVEVEAILCWLSHHEGDATPRVNWMATVLSSFLSPAVREQEVA